MKNIFYRIMVCVMVFICSFGRVFSVYADSKTGFGVSPMRQSIILNAGDSYTGKFRILNRSDKALFYHIDTLPFYVDENYTTIFEEHGHSGQIAKWSVLNTPEDGKIEINDFAEVNFTINVPNDAPAGGQYLSFVVSSGTDANGGGSESVGINETIAIGYLVFAEIAGTTVRQGEVTSADVPGFLFSGNIAGNSTIKNTGNVHSTATYKLQVFPLFSDEEVYTNEEDPETKTILPDRTLYNSTTWSNTPSMGIFNVVYTAEFEGVSTEVKKMVIVCPLWLLAVIIFGAILIIIWLVSKNKSRKKK